MKYPGPTHTASVLGRRTKWTLLALVALLVPLALIQSGSAQRNGLRREETKDAAESQRKADEKPPTPDEEKLRLAAAMRPRGFRQSGLSPEPESSQAVGFAVSKPLAEVARNQRKPTAAEREEARQEEDREAAENRVTRVVSPQARAEADEAAARGVVRDTAIQTNAPAIAIPTPITTF